MTYYLEKMLEWNEENGFLINKYIKQTIQKQRRIHKKYIYRKDRVDQYISFTEDNFMLTTGQLTPIKFYPTQKWWVELMLGYDMIDENGEQVQLTNEFFLNLGRGSGKSTFMAPRVLNWMILGGQYGGESQVIAYDNNQARHVYDQVRNQAQASPLLSKMHNNDLFKSTKTGMVFTPMLTKFFKQTNDTNRAQGGNTSLNVFDEVHTYRDDITEAVNKGSRQKQSNWQSDYITSGGVTRNGLYDSMIERFTSKSEFNNDRSFSLLYRLENIEQVKDKRNWSMALPMIGYLPKMSAVTEEYDISQGDPALQTKFLAMNMGMQMNDTVYYFTTDEALRHDFDLSVFEGESVYVGIDLSLVGDLTTIAFLINKEGRYYGHTINFSTRKQYDSLDTDMQERYTRFIEEGSLILLETDYINVNDLIPYLAEFKKKTQCRFKKIGYDPSRYEILETLIERYFYDRDGDKQKPIRQGFAMSDYIKLFKQEVGKSNVWHNQKLLEWSFMNVAVRVGDSGDHMYKKMLDKDKIDPVVALTMAMEVYVLDEL
ncbi:terminase large subunit [Lactococcus petauri]|nr:terminase large subunit [Lactococcus petauri]